MHTLITNTNQALGAKLRYSVLVYHKVREYFVYRDDNGLGSMASLFQFQY